MRRFRAMIKKEIIHMVRDPRTLIVILIMPVLQLLILGYANNTDIKNIPTVIFDQSNSQSSRALLDAFRVTGYFSFDYVASTDAQVNDLIGSGKVKVGIIIPSNYSGNLLSGTPAQVSVVIDGSDPTTASTALSAATLTGQSHGISLRLQQLALAGASSSAGGLPGGCAHACALQPRPARRLQYCPRSDRHDPVPDRHEPDGPLHRKGTRTRHHRTTDRDPHPQLGTGPGKDHPLRPGLLCRYAPDPADRHRCGSACPSAAA